MQGSAWRSPGHRPAKVPTWPGAARRTRYEHLPGHRGRRNPCFPFRRCGHPSASTWPESASVIDASTRANEEQHPQRCPGAAARTSSCGSGRATSLREPGPAASSSPAGSAGSPRHRVLHHGSGALGDNISIHKDAILRPDYRPGLSRLMGGVNPRRLGHLLAADQIENYNEMNWVQVQEYDRLRWSSTARSTAAAHRPVEQGQAVQCAGAADDHHRLPVVLPAHERLALGKSRQPSIDEQHREQLLDHRAPWNRGPRSPEAGGSARRGGRWARAMRYVVGRSWSALGGGLRRPCCSSSATAAADRRVSTPASSPAAATLALPHPHHGLTARNGRGRRAPGGGNCNCSRSPSPTAFARSPPGQELVAAPEGARATTSPTSSRTPSGDNVEGAGSVRTSPVEGQARGRARAAPLGPRRSGSLSASTSWTGFIFDDPVPAQGPSLGSDRRLARRLPAPARQAGRRQGRHPRAPGLHRLWGTSQVRQYYEVEAALDALAASAPPSS